MLEFAVVIICLFVNAFFSAFEMAFVTTSKEEINELEEAGQSVAKKLSLFKKKPERTLSVIQIGITLVGAIAAAVGGNGAVESLVPYIVENYGLSASTAEGIAVIIAILPLTYFSVVFGELLPKTIALKHPEKILIFGTGILGSIDRILSPIVSFLEVSTNFLLKLIGIQNAEDEEEDVGQTIEIGSLQAYHQKFVQNLVALKGKKVSKTMIPWDKVAYMNYSDSEEEVRAKIGSTPHSRFPVVDLDTIVGILNVKELPETHKQIQMPWQSVLRPAIIVPETEKILEAFLKMQAKQNHIAVVVRDETFAGILTIEDVIEEIVGDIHDNSDYSRASRMLSNRSKINLKS